MKKLLFILFMCLVYYTSSAQITYVDIATAPAMITDATQLRNEQNKTNNSLSRIRDAQVLVQSQLMRANDIHNRIHTGLREVSGTLRNALSVKRIYEISEDIIKELNKAQQEVREHPQYSVLAAQSVSLFTRRSIELSSEVTKILQSGDLNLMSSGERQRLLNHILFQLTGLRSAAFGMSFSIRRAVRLGFWRSINPFATWVNQDATIMRGIIRDAQRLKR